MVYRATIALLLCGLLTTVVLPFSQARGAERASCGLSSTGEPYTLGLCRGYRSYTVAFSPDVSLVLDPVYLDPTTLSDPRLRAAIEQQNATIRRLEAQPLPAWPNSPRIYLDFNQEGLQLHFAFAQPSVRKAIGFDGVSYARDDNISILVAKPDSPTTTMLATMNPNGKCSSKNFELRDALNHHECNAKLARTLACPSPAVCWGGTLTIPFSDLDHDGLLNGMDVRVRRILWLRDPDSGKNYSASYYSGGDDPAARTQWVHLSVSQAIDLSNEQFVQAGPNIGHVADAPPHPGTVAVYAPLSIHTLFAGSFGDQSSSVLSLRDSSLSHVFGSFADKLKCFACGSFQTDTSTIAAWRPAVTSVGILGVDFSDIGVDSSAFSFKAVGFQLMPDINI